MRRLFPAVLAAALAVIPLAAQTPAHKVVLTWTASADAATQPITYDIYRAAGACSSAAEPAPLSGASLISATTYTDSAVAGGTLYCYDAVAVSASGAISAPSNEITVTVPTAAVTGITETAAPGQVTLSWMADPDAANYSVGRATGACSSSSQFAALISSTTALTYTDKTAVDGSEYCYQVTATSASAVASAGAEGAPVTPPLAPPANLAGTAQ